MGTMIANNSISRYNSISKLACYISLANINIFHYGRHGQESRVKENVALHFASCQSQLKLMDIYI